MAIDFSHVAGFEEELQDIYYMLHSLLLLIMVVKSWSDFSAVNVIFYSIYGIRVFVIALPIKVKYGASTLGNIHHFG